MMIDLEFHPFAAGLLVRPSRPSVLVDRDGNHLEPVTEAEQAEIMAAEQRGWAEQYA
jgi:hypothetical protein